MAEPTAGRKRQRTKRHPHRKSVSSSGIDSSEEMASGKGDPPSERPPRKRIDSEYLAGRKRERLAGAAPKEDQAPRNLIEHAMQAKKIREGYKQSLQNLSKETPASEQIARLKQASQTGTNYLGRTASLTRGYRFKVWHRATNGHTTNELLMPAADVNPGHALHASLLDMTQGEIVYMTGKHLIWHDMHGDELLSYSIDALFLVHHALNRHSQDQSDTTIQFLDRRRAKDVEGEPASFYPALEIYETFKVPEWEGWAKLGTEKLYPRKFTQEYLTQGTVVVNDERFLQAPVENLIRDGLYDLFPAFEVPDDCVRAGLYSGQVKMRTIGYPPGHVKPRPFPRLYAYYKCAKRTPFTTELLALVQKLTRNFMSNGSGEDWEDGEPHLHIFLCFLTFEKRPRRDEIFLDWIKSHYSASDVTDLYDDGNGGVRPGFTRVANNLPGVMQYLDLVRDAAFAFGLPDLPATELETQNALTKDYYAGEDAVLDRDDLLFWQYDEGTQTANRERARIRKLEKEKLLEMLVGSANVAAATEKQAASDVVGEGEDVTAMSDGSGAEVEGVAAVDGQEASMRRFEQLRNITPQGDDSTAGTSECAATGTTGKEAAEEENGEAGRVEQEEAPDGRAQSDAASNLDWLQSEKDQDVQAQTSTAKSLVPRMPGSMEKARRPGELQTLMRGQEAKDGTKGTVDESSEDEMAL